MGMCSLSARIGGIICPIILGLGQVWPSFPLFIFGVSCVVAALLALFLPETGGQPLPQTLEDAEQLGK